MPELWQYLVIFYENSWAKNVVFPISDRLSKKNAQTVIFFWHMKKKKNEIRD